MNFWLVERTYRMLYRCRSQKEMFTQEEKKD